MQILKGDVFCFTCFFLCIHYVAKIVSQRSSGAWNKQKMQTTLKFTASILGRGDSTVVQAAQNYSRVFGFFLLFQWCSHQWQKVIGGFQWVWIKSKWRIFSVCVYVKCYRRISDFCENPRVSMMSCLGFTGSVNAMSVHLPPHMHTMSSHWHFRCWWAKCN